MLSKTLANRFKDILGHDNFSISESDLHLYSYDGTGRIHLPNAVAWPADTAEVSALVKLAAENNIPVVARGAGSGLSGGSVPVRGGIVCVMTRFNRVLEIDADNLLAVAEPGVIVADFQALVEKEGLFYPPDPASREFATLGGNAAENAGGTRAVKYGVTKDYVLGLEAVLGTAEIIQTGVRTIKGVVGYDLTRMLIGSEGTLGIITKITLRLIPKPETTQTLLAVYSSIGDAAKTVAFVTKARIIPATLEFMDRASIDCVKGYVDMEVDPKAQAMLLIETDGPLEQARAEAEAIVQICKQCSAISARLAADEEEADLMWQARRALSPSMFKVAAGKFNEDIVVPRDRIPDMTVKVEEISKKHGLPIICFGHAGDGNIHVNIMFDPDDEAEVQKAKATVRDVFAATLKLGGTMSGEHGIGLVKSEYIEMELKPPVLSLMKRIKTAFDPKGILNPGKIFPPSGHSADD